MWGERERRGRPSRWSAAGSEERLDLWEVTWVIRQLSYFR